MAQSEDHPTHGKLADPAWPQPVLATFCPVVARPGYNASTILAHEYQEAPGVLEKKVEVVAQMLRDSEFTTLYTGAGISTSCGIGDYATKAGDKSLSANNKPKTLGLGAEPSLFHHVMAAAHRVGHIHEWVQQNHDGLPQKAGLPQEAINEIHGAWFDPSNPVVPMTGSLRSDLMQRLEDVEIRGTLCVAVGTSLCGMNADRLVETAAANSKVGRGLGSIIVGLQRTQHDDACSLRLFCKADDFAARLAAQLGLELKPAKVCRPPAEAAVSKDIFVVPYDRSGRLVPGNAPVTEWDLSEGAQVRVTGGRGRGFTGVVLGRSRDGHYRVELPRMREGHPKHGQGKVLYVLGSWWVAAAVRGSIERLPLVNVRAAPARTASHLLKK